MKMKKIKLALLLSSVLVLCNASAGKAIDLEIGTEAIVDDVIENAVVENNGGEIEEEILDEYNSDTESETVLQEEALETEFEDDAELVIEAVEEDVILFQAEMEKGSALEYSFDPDSGTLTIGINVTPSQENKDARRMKDYSDSDTRDWEEIVKNADLIKELFVETGVLTIGTHAFLGCTNLQTITFDGNVEKVGNDAFDGCENLRKVNGFERVKTFETGAFEKNCPFVQDYLIARALIIDWNDSEKILSIKKVADHELPKNIAPGTDEYKLMHMMKEYSEASEYEWAKYASQIETLIVDAGIMSIGNRAFQNCTSLKTVELKGIIYNLSDFAFSGCSALKTISWDNIQGTIGAYAFDGCSSLESITISGGVNRVEEFAFANCKNVRLVAYGDPVSFDEGEHSNLSFGPDEWPNGTFMNCESLRMVDLRKRTGNTNPQSESARIAPIILNTMTIGLSSQGHKGVYFVVPEKGKDMGYNENEWSIFLVQYGNTADPYEDSAHQPGEEIAYHPHCECNSERIYKCKWKWCSDPVVVSEPPVPHKWKDVSIKQYCDHLGERTQECTVCGSTQILQDAPMIAHTWGEWKVVSKGDINTPPTKQRTCSVCGTAEQKKEGSPLTPFIKVTAEKFNLKKKQKTKGFVVEMQEGDEIASVTYNKKYLTVSYDAKKGTFVIKAKKKLSKKQQMTITLKSGLSKTVTIKIQKKKVTTKAVENIPKTLTLKVGDTSELLAKLNPFTSVQKIRYSVSPKKILSISKKGKITAKKAGTATITVKSGKKKAKCKVIVQP